MEPSVSLAVSMAFPQRPLPYLSGWFNALCIAPQRDFSCTSFPNFRFAFRRGLLSVLIRIFASFGARVTI